MFPGGNKGMKDLMKKAQKMQQDLAKAQEELANKIVEGSAGGGMVKVEMNGKNQILSLKIDKEVVDPEDVERKITKNVNNVKHINRVTIMKRIYLKII